MLNLNLITGGIKFGRRFGVYLTGSCFLGIVIEGIYATWNLVNHHSHLSAQEKRRNGLEISG
ncbi:hypothetical protein JTF06_12790 [Desemzia sp. RIT804]|uniref:hypothetical protein n=1 Tax=Desemzia sp. RIT 804 TaxID=2810209 RepID=UPI00194EF76E|nr:hypothetical protein [Desemzia sp. RIT 804]MBM6615762.1 hypothetical protein [Desemzia sp. RIT 804]